MRVFFAGYDEADLPGVLPVIQALHRHRKWLPVLVPGVYYREGQGVLTTPAPRGVEVMPLRLDAAEQRRASQRGQQLRREARRWADTAASADATTARGLRSFLRRSAMPALFAAYATTEMAAAKLAVSEKPSLVVLPEDTDYLRGRLLARVFREHGAYVVCLPPWYYSAFVRYPLIGTRYAHSYLVGTHSFARRLLHAGVGHERLWVVGCPVFDEVAVTPAPPPGRFLYALQGLPWEQGIVGDLLRIFAGEPEATLILKSHPQLPRPDWLRRIRQPRNVRLAAQDKPLASLLKDTRCVIAQSSRMLFEAAVSGREILVPHYDATPLPIDIPAKNRRHVVASSAEELQRMVRQTMAGRGHSLTRADIAPYHPKATQRTVEVLSRLLSEHAPNHRD